MPADDVERRQRDDEARHPPDGRSSAPLTTPHATPMPMPDEERDDDRDRARSRGWWPNSVRRRVGRQAEHRADRQVDVPRDDRPSSRRRARSARIVQLPRMMLISCRSTNRGSIAVRDDDQQGEQRRRSRSSRSAEDDDRRAGAGACDAAVAPGGRSAPRRSPSAAPPRADRSRPRTIVSSDASACGELGDEPALAHDEDAVGDAEHLGQLGGDHQDRRRPGRRARRAGGAPRPWCRRRCRASARRRSAATGWRPSHLPSTTFCWLPPDSDVAGFGEPAVLELQPRRPSRAAKRRSASARMKPRCRRRRSEASATLRAIDISMTRPCWRRSSGTKPDPGRHRARSATPRASGFPLTVDRARVVAVDAEDRAGDLAAAGADEPGERDDLAARAPRTRRR